MFRSYGDSEEEIFLGNGDKWDISGTYDEEELRFLRNRKRCQMVLETLSLVQSGTKLRPYISHTGSDW